MDLKITYPARPRAQPPRALSTPLIRLQREIDRLFDDFTQGWASHWKNARADAQAWMWAETENQIEITA